jgi:Xaa-Pro aminopeptidase
MGSSPSSIGTNLVVLDKGLDAYATPAAVSEGSGTGRMVDIRESRGLDMSNQPNGPLERINAPISTGELERRWKAVRAAMEEQRIDVLLMQSSNDFMGGYVKWFTDVPATNGYPVCVAFPRDDRMIVVTPGAFEFDRKLDATGDAVRRGVGRHMSTPSFTTAHYTGTYQAELIGKALEPYSLARIGLVGTGEMSYAFVEYFRRGRLANAELVEVSDLVDRIKMIKSEEEIALIRRTAAMQDACMKAAFAAIKPGMRDIEVAAVAEHVGRGYGSEQGLFLCASGPLNTAPTTANRHNQNRVIRERDQFILLVESSGPGGYYTELGRTCVLGKATQEMKDEHAFVMEARQVTLNLLKPGTSCKDIWETHNAFMRRNKRPEAKRLYCHGQGYDMVERPLVRFDEPLPIGSNMNIVVHPTYSTERAFTWICDNFLVGEQGVKERLHAFPEEIVELG